MLRPGCVLLFVVLLTPYARPQPPWLQAYASTTPSYCCTYGSVREAANGDLLLVTRQGIQGTGDRFVRFQRTTADGAPIVQQDLVRPSAVGQWEIFDVLELPDNTVLAVGWYGFQSIVMRFTSGGDLLSALRYSMGSLSTIRTAELLNDSTVLLSGDVHTSGQQDMVLLTTTFSGALIDAQQWRIDGHNSMSVSAARCSNGDHVIALVSEDTLGGISLPARNLALMRTDSLGTELWSHRLLMGGQWSWLREVVELPDGDLLLSGSHLSNDDVTLPFLVRTDPSGLPRWGAVYFRPDLPSMDLSTLTTTVQNEHVVFALSFPGATYGMMVVDTSGAPIAANAGNQGTPCNMTTTSNGDVALYLFVDGPLGSPVPAIHRTADAALPQCSAPFPLQTTALGAAAFGSAIVSPIAPAVVDVTGDLLPQPVPLTVIEPCITMGTLEQARSVLRIWPQPAAGIVYVEAPSAIRSLALVDATGRTVQVPVSIDRDRAELDLHTLQKGHYLVLTLTDVGRYARHVIVGD